MDDPTVTADVLPFRRACANSKWCVHDCVHGGGSETISLLNGKSMCLRKADGYNRCTPSQGFVSWKESR